VLGVMAIRSRDAAVAPWIRELTRDALNTTLSKVHGLQVYSRQKIDFLREKRALTEIEAAEQLGMSKMLSATVDVANGNVILELEIVDIATGLLVATEHVQGPRDRLIDLQNQVAERALHVLGVELTTDERETVFAERTNEMLESYRMLTETLGGVAPASTDRPARPRDRGRSWLDWVPQAHAADAGPEEQAVRGLLDAYRAALEARSIDTLATLQVEMAEGQRQAYGRYFGNSENLQVRFSDVEIMVEGEDALATFVRKDQFTDARSGREMRLEVRMTTVLTKQDGRWKIKSLQTPS
jgi:TolB-like protein/ketosteroid isomerase-like protein